MFRSRRTGAAALAGAALALGLTGFGLAGCGSSSGGGPAGPASQAFLPSDDTFVNSGNPDNNNGASASLFVGVDGHSGVMRALVQFDVATALAHATVTSAKLEMTLRALGNGTAGAASVDSLAALTETWTQGNGVADAAMTFTVGQACGDAVSGATWNQPSCAAGTTTAWATPGGSVAGAPSATVDTAGVDLDGPVIWDSGAAGNGGLVADVQRWIDDPTSNHGWRISSGIETSTATAQRFYSAEADGTHGPTLTIAYRPGS
jgi:hypothetical protein